MTRPQVAVQSIHAIQTLPLVDFPHPIKQMELSIDTDPVNLSIGAGFDLQRETTDSTHA